MRSFLESSLIHHLSLIGFGLIVCCLNAAHCLHLQMTSRTFGRVSLVTGANKGIGKEIARRLASSSSISSSQESVTVLGCRDLRLGEAACRELESDPGVVGRVVPIHLDLLDPDSATAAATTIGERYGKLDVLVNNAAICFNDPTLYGKVEHTPFERQADITIRTNYFGTLSTTMAMLPLLLSSSSSSSSSTTTTTNTARIINIASAAGRLGIFPPGSPHYKTVTSRDLTVDGLSALMRDFVSAAEDGTHAARGFPNTCYGMSKLGIIALTKVLAKKYYSSSSSCLMVNSVDPGFCKTDQNNQQGYVPAARGALTPFLLATLAEEELGQGGERTSGKHFYEEHEIAW